MIIDESKFLYNPIAFKVIGYSLSSVPGAFQKLERARALRENNFKQF